MKALRFALFLTLITTELHPNQEKEWVQGLTKLLEDLHKQEDPYTSKYQPTKLYIKKKGPEHTRDPWVPHPQPGLYPLAYNPAYYYVRVALIARDELPRRTSLSCASGKKKLMLSMTIRQAPVEIFLSLTIPVTFRVRT